MRMTKERKFVCPHPDCDSTELFVVREEKTACSLSQSKESNEPNGWEYGKEEVWDCKSSVVQCSNGHTLLLKDGYPVHDDIEELEEWFEEGGTVEQI